MRNRFDQLGKQIGCEALGPSGSTVAHDEIAPDAQHADLRHEPLPARTGERTRLGLLGRLASLLCLIELYGHAPDEDELLACLGKLIAFRQQRARIQRKKRARAARGQAQEHAPPKPFLWIITAGRPSSVLAELHATPAPDWPPGVYFAPGILRTAIVVASELPRDRSTLLVRLMAAGPLLPQAIEDLSALPPDAHERAVAEQILLRLRHALGKKPSRTPEEEEFIVTMYSTWEQAREQGRDEGRREGRREGRDEGRNEGRREGRDEGRREVLRDMLTVKFGPLPDAAAARIQGASAVELNAWVLRVLSAATLDEVFASAGP